MANHQFTPLTLAEPGNENKCAICSHTQNTHGECECCNSSDTLIKFKGMMMCQDCYHKEINLTRQSESESDTRLAAERERANQVIQINEVLKKSEDIDKSITIRTDIFNAETVAINKLKEAIDADPAIENKPYKLAQVILARFANTKNVVFELNQKMVEVGNQQKAIQVYLNTMANTLRAEEREALKIADINYKPNPVKLTSGSDKTKSVKTRSSKVLDKDELAKYAKKLGISSSSIQMIVVSKGITIEQAAKLIKANIEKAKAIHAANTAANVK